MLDYFTTKLTELRRRGAKFGFAMDRLVLVQERWVLLWAHWNAREVEVSAYVPSAEHRVCWVRLEALAPTELLLVDIRSNPAYVGQGLATAALQFAELLLRPHGYQRITGRLVAADAKDRARRARQLRFYKKNGYAVELNGDSGFIYKELT